MAENKKCRLCQKDFVVEDADLEFLDKISPEFGGQKYQIPAPTMCPVCRSRNRLVYRNLRNLYKRNDPQTNKTIFTHYDETVKFPIYDTEFWWSDQWDGTKFARDYDFNRSFFEQYRELYEQVPSLARNVLTVEDCDYTNGIGNCKHCFLAFNIDRSENCFYVTDGRDSVSCLDCLAIIKCELCYECIRCENCYDLKYSIRCADCRESMFLSDCRNVSNSIGCCNLTNKQYYILNKQATKEEYEAKIKELENADNRQKLAEEFAQFQLQFPKRYYYGAKNEDSTGDDIQNTKNARVTYYADDVENCKYCNYVFQAKDCMDYDVFGDNSNWIYNCIATGENCSKNIFCMHCWSGSTNNMYCNLTAGAKDCFGCCGIKHKQYCILNKQYTQQEYEELVPKIIEHMKQTGEWGEFFPFEMSPFSFNETLAHEYYPLEKSQVEAMKMRWKEPTDIAIDPNLPVVESSTLPATIDGVTEEICQKVIKCSESGRLYQIQKGELAFYQSKKIPLPRVHSEVRHMRRVEKRNPYLLWTRDCSCQGECQQHSGQCPNKFETSYSPDRPEKVYCESCYQKSVL